MQWFRNRKTRTKIALGFGVVIALMGLVGWQAIRAIGNVNAGVVAAVQHGEGLADLLRAGLEEVKMSRSIRNAVLDDNSEDVDKRIAESNELFGSFQEAMKRYVATLVIEANRKKAEEIVRLEDELRAARVNIFALAREQRDAEAVAEIKKFRAPAEAIDRITNELVQAKFELMRQAETEGAQTYASTVRFVAALLLSIVALGFGIAFVTARSIARPLGQAVDALQKVAEGDLTQSLDSNGKDEVGQLAAALNAAVTAMRTALKNATDSATGSASAAEQLSGAAEQLSSGSQEQASSLEETAASLEEITGTVKQNADNARQASQLAVSSREVAEKGGAVVREAVAAMAEINASSRKIADIITAIDEIAFQTNLLALNAAVEAARAGEQGRGFAVVAAEVRNLAQRSATAAKEIKALISDSVAKVEGGSALVNRSGQTLEDIVNSVKRVTDIVAEIAAASAEQSAGIDQVNKAMAQMDTVTQANASQTEELSATASTMADQAGHLQKILSRFKLDGGAGGAHAVASKKATPAAKKPQPTTAAAAPHDAPKPGAPARTASPHAAPPHEAPVTHTPDVDPAAGGFEEF